MEAGPGDRQPATPQAGGVAQEVGADQPDNRRPARVTTIRKAIVIGVLAALVVGGASGLAAVRLTDRQSDLDELASQVSQQEAQLAQLSSQADAGAAEADRLNAEIVALKGQVFTLEAERLSLEDQLSQYENPAPGPTPTAALTVNWIELANEGRAYGPNKRWVVLNVTIENTTDGEVDVFYSGSQFTAKDAQEFVYPAAFPPGPFNCGPIDHARGQLLAPALSGGSLGPGEKATGAMAFDLPAGGVVLTKLVWSAGQPGVAEIVVDLPPPQVPPDWCVGG